MQSFKYSVDDMFYLKKKTASGLQAASLALLRRERAVADMECR